MYHPLSLNGYSKIINAVKRQRNLGLIWHIENESKIVLSWYVNNANAKLKSTSLF